MPSRPKLDPAPRSYPEFITLVRRSARATEAAPPETTMAQIEVWLLGSAIKENDLQALFQALVWRLVAAG
ncbi:MAG TPA: hypothetical protein VK200_00400, partial [Candidatus Limnocylindrales bacterium]|nr:hypothetical protein [Candidatus Limnocylindrales bacterium]